MSRLARTRPPMETADPEGRSARSTSAITRWAGPISLAAAALILTSQLLNEALHWWYEAFVGPGIAIHAPQLADMPHDGSLVAGAIATIGSFSLGWILFGIATLRGHLLPTAPAILVIIGGAVGALVLWTPYQIPLAIAVGWMGYHLVNAVPQRPARRSRCCSRQPMRSQ